MSELLKPQTGESGFPDDPALTAAPLSLRWVGHQPGNVVRTVRRINRAQSWQEFDAALGDWSAPSQVFVFADCHGNIGYRLAGAVPIRRSGNGLVPAPGWDSSYAWNGVIPDDELPRLLNPASGMIVTANNKITGDDYPHVLTFETMPGWRARRIQEMLGQKKRLTMRDMEQIQLDQTSLYAEALTPLLTNHLSDDPYVRVAVNMLQDWGYHMDQESAAALVFHYTLLHLLDLTFGQKLGATAAGYLGKGSSPIFLINGFMLRAETRLLELLQQEEGLALVCGRCHRPPTPTRGVDRNGAQIGCGTPAPGGESHAAPVGLGADAPDPLQPYTGQRANSGLALQPRAISDRRRRHYAQPDRVHAGVASRSRPGSGQLPADFRCRQLGRCAKRNGQRPVRSPGQPQLCGSDTHVAGRGVPQDALEPTGG